MSTPASIISTRRRNRPVACIQFRRQDWHEPAVLATHGGTLNTGKAERCRIGPNVLLLAYRQNSARRFLVRQSGQATQQSRLLRVLADHEITPLGASNPAKVNICELKQPPGASISTSENYQPSAPAVEDGLRVIGTDSSCDASTQPRSRLTHNIGPRDENAEREELLRLLRRQRWNLSRAEHETNAARTTTTYRRMSRMRIVLPHLLRL